MSHSRRHSSRSKLYSQKRTIIGELWDEFWQPPLQSCPKCKCTHVEYYDPFLFAFWRSVTGRRRFKCSKCGFIWRRSRSDSILRRSGFFLKQ
jgi:hypothetical protein